MMLNVVRCRSHILAAIIAALTALPAAATCYPDHASISVRGIAAFQSIEDDGGNAESVWVLLLDSPICVVRPTNGPNISVSRIRLSNPPERDGVAIEINGSLRIDRNAKNDADAITIVTQSKQSTTKKAAPRPPRRPGVET